MVRRLVVILVGGAICMLAVTSVLAVQYKEAPMLRVKVAVGELPRVEERLPLEPFVVDSGVLISEEDLDLEIGEYGGILRMIHPWAGWSGNVYIMNIESLLAASGIGVEGIRPSIVENLKISEDEKIFTFHMREGLKWSDGAPVTTEDVLFVYEDVLLNDKLTSTFPQWLKAGGRAGGEPMELEIIDEYTFRISFTESYGGFLAQLAIVGWRRYDDLLKPKHYLKQFHPRYTPTEKLESLIKEEGLAGGEWWALFTMKEFPLWKMMRAEAVGYPFLTPWIPVKGTTTMMLYERNPYYFKVDTEGNQLPYIDKIRLELVSDIEMAQMKIIAGEVDYERDCCIESFSFYKEYEEKAGYRTLWADSHTSPPVAYFNYTHLDPAWRKLVHDIRFRKALGLVVNYEEIIDALREGIGESPEVTYAIYDPDGANRFLDEMGLTERDADGWRLGFDGKRLSIPFEIEAGSPSYVSVAEMLADYWRELGIETTIKTEEMGFFRTRAEGNNVKATVYLTSRPIWRIYEDYLPWTGWWGPLWWTWYNTGGKEGEEPPAWIKRVFELSELIRKVRPGTPEDKKLLKELYSTVDENILFIRTGEKAIGPMIVSAGMGNVPQEGFAIATNYSMEQFFFEQ